MVSKFNKRGTNKEKVWKHGAILEGNKDSPLETVKVVKTNDSGT